MEGKTKAQVIESPLLPQPLLHLPAVPQQELTVRLFQVDKEFWLANYGGGAQWGAGINLLGAETDERGAEASNLQFYCPVQDNKQLIIQLDYQKKKKKEKERKSCRLAAIMQTSHLIQILLTLIRQYYGHNREA